MGRSVSKGFILAMLQLSGRASADPGTAQPHHHGSVLDLRGPAEKRRASTATQAAALLFPGSMGHGGAPGVQDESLHLTALRGGIFISK